MRSICIPFTVLTYLTYQWKTTSEHQRTKLNVCRRKLCVRNSHVKQQLDDATDGFRWCTQICSGSFYEHINHAPAIHGRAFAHILCLSWAEEAYRNHVFTPLLLMCTRSKLDGSLGRLPPGRFINCLRGLVCREIFHCDSSVHHGMFLISLKARTHKTLCAVTFVAVGKREILFLVCIEVSVLMQDHKSDGILLTKGFLVSKTTLACTLICSYDEIDLCS